AVWESATRAIERARSGQGPTLIECKTFRMTGHSAHDDAGYVPPERFEYWKERDPIHRFEHFLTDRGLISTSGVDELQTRINHEIDDAIQLAEKDPFPEPEECLKDVYYEEAGNSGSDPEFHPYAPDHLRRSNSSRHL